MKTVKLFMLFITMALISCSSESDFNKGKSQLESQGYTDVENTGYSSFCCAEKETYSTGFKCKDRNGNIVEGCFCSGAFKGITIRFK